MRNVKAHMLTSTKMMLPLDGGSAFLRPSALERSMGRFLRSPEGHDPAPADPPAADPAPADPAPADPVVPAADPAADPAPAEPSALNSDPAADPAGDPPADPDPALAVPEAYELTAPEGFTLDTAAVEIATPVFKELGLNNEQANKLMPVAAEWAAKIQDDANKAIIAQVQADRAQWLVDAKADPEIGGANWDKTLVSAAAALDKLGFPKGSEFRNLLDESGLGNNLGMIRAWKRVNDAIGEDGFVRSEMSGTTKKTDAELFYGENYNKGA